MPVLTSVLPSALQRCALRLCVCARALRWLCAAGSVLLALRAGVGWWQQSSYPLRPMASVRGPCRLVTPWFRLVSVCLGCASVDHDRLLTQRGVPHAKSNEEQGAPVRAIEHRQASCSTRPVCAGPQGTRGQVPLPRIATPGRVALCVSMPRLSLLCLSGVDSAGARGGVMVCRNAKASWCAAMLCGASHSGVRQWCRGVVSCCAVASL